MTLATTGTELKSTHFISFTVTAFSRFTLVAMFYSLVRLGPRLAFLLSVLAVQLVFALPTDYDLFHEEPSGSLDRRAPNFYARILPLGASIVQGRGSSSGNG